MIKLHHIFWANTFAKTKIFAKTFAKTSLFCENFHENEKFPLFAKMKNSVFVSTLINNDIHEHFIDDTITG
jgi:hypothetical protein